MTAVTVPAVYRLNEWAEADGVYRDYRNDYGQTVTVKAAGPAGTRPEPDTAAEAAQVFARSAARPAAGPACRCPDHPASILQPFPGGAARGSCPVDGRSHQMSPPEVTP